MSAMKPQRVTVTIEDAEINYADIIATCKVVPDDNMADAPWQNCDGWNHTAERVRFDREEGQRQSDRYVARSSHDGGSVWLTLSPKAGIPTWEYYHALGASRQVAHELAAQTLAKAYETLYKWYVDGWQYWGVTCDFKGEHDSLWGIDDYDYALGEVCADVADNVAAQLAQAGYVIVNQPAPVKPKPRTRMAYLGGVNAFNLK